MTIVNEFEKKYKTLVWSLNSMLAQQCTSNLPIGVQSEI